MAEKGLCRTYGEVAKLREIEYIFSNPVYDERAIFIAYQMISSGVDKKDFIRNEKLIDLLE